MRPLFSARALRISKISSCLRMPVAPGHVELLGDLRERADAHVLERREIDALYLFRRRRRPPFGLCRRRLGGCRRLGLLLLWLLRLRLFASLSISFHSSSSPSPVTAETGSTESSNTDSSCSQRADPFAARELVDLGRHDGRPSGRSLQPLPGRHGRSRGPDAARPPAAAPTGACAQSTAADERLELVAACAPLGLVRPPLAPARSRTRQVHQVERRGTPPRATR